MSVNDIVGAPFADITNSLTVETCDGAAGGNFTPNSVLSHSPRKKRSFEKKPSTLASVLLQREQERAVREAEHRAQLDKVRVELYQARTRMLACAKEKYIPAALVLEWSASSFSSAAAIALCSPDEIGISESPAHHGPNVELATLKQQWLELTCLLRTNIVDGAALAETNSKVESSLVFLDQIVELAKEGGTATAGGAVLQGTIYQELLRDLAECGIAGAMVDNAGLGKQEGSAKSMEECAEASEMARSLGCAPRWVGLMAGANTVRNLVRIKLQDDNDLRAARLALKCCSACLTELFLHAKQRKISPFAMVEVLESE